MFGQFEREPRFHAGPLLAAAPVISALGTAFSAISALTQKAPKAPRETLPGVMPTEDSALVAEAKRRTLIAQSARGGRASTFLSDDGDDSFGGN